MKFKLLMVGLVAVLAISLMACSAPTPRPLNGISCDEFAKNNNISEQVEFASGEFFTVTLCSNPTTGFSWSEAAQISDTGVVKQLEHEFIGPESATPPPAGAPGQEVWTFKTNKKGTSTIYLEYGRPWEGGEKAVWTYTLTVTVK